MRGDCHLLLFFVVGVVMLISFLLLYASIRINCINIRNGAKMESLNNLSASIYADTYRSQRETNFSEYLSTLLSSSYTEMLEDTVREGLSAKVPCLQTITRLKISLLIFM